MHGAVVPDRKCRLRPHAEAGERPASRRARGLAHQGADSRVHRVVDRVTRGGSIIRTEAVPTRRKRRHRDGRALTSPPFHALTSLTADPLAETALP